MKIQINHMNKGKANENTDKPITIGMWNSLLTTAVILMSCISTDVEDDRGLQLQAVTNNQVFPCASNIAA